MWLQAVQHVLSNTEDVGARFSEEARRIHYGESEQRGIRGQATAEQRAELADEGIEVMQLIVVAFTIPWLILLARTPFYPAVRVGGAVFAGLASLGWIAERGLEIPNPLEPVVAWLAHHPAMLVAALAVVALLATGWREWKKSGSAISSPSQEPSN